ncbi:hypothetical protein [Brachybacterium paraconglomeratum]|uniref:hypothetical protein n=1 Tax=Brachybacterium paraconglomeratum TaxID=173362 RepID=UPI00223AC78F|nr:hypothetical protein [Brachybacterium paraconglomeratum]MCT1438625.1 hypothetical protein [Brachybacterium paraconglomeratum]
MTDGTEGKANDVVIPEAIATVVEAMWTHVWEVEPPAPTAPDGETAEWYADAVGYCDSRAEILTDARSLLTAYAREIASPRPPMGELAAAQGISITSLRRRYNETHVVALRHLVDETGTIDEIIAPFRTLYDDHLRHTSSSRDDEISKRHEMAQLYAAHEIQLAEQIGIYAPRRAPTESREPEDKLRSRRTYDNSPFEPGKLYPGRRRRLLSEYNPRIMEDALQAGNPQLLDAWHIWTKAR